MGFHKSSMDIHLKSSHILCAYCRKPTGEATYSELNLNEFLGTKKGQLRWGLENFAEKVSDVNLELEGATHEPILHAQIAEDDGTTHESQVNLADCIKNENGNLQFMDCF